MDMEIVLAGGKRVHAIYSDGVGNVTLKTDQPKHKGGQGTGPSPFDMFLASIGT